jgi:hypothetical protein
VEWYLILRAAPYGPRPWRQKSRLVFLKIPVIFENDGNKDNTLLFSREDEEPLSYLICVGLLGRQSRLVISLQIFSETPFSDVVEGM